MVGGAHAVVEPSRQPESPRLHGQRDRREPASEPPIGEAPAERRRAGLRERPHREEETAQAGRETSPIDQVVGHQEPDREPARRSPGGARRWPRRTRGGRRRRPGSPTGADASARDGGARSAADAPPAPERPRREREPEHHERESPEIHDRPAEACPRGGRPPGVPTTAPTLAASPSQPRARPRRPAGVARVTRAGALAMTSAAPNPCTTLAPSSHGHAGARPHRRWVTPVSASPARKTRACPARSASRPAGIRRQREGHHVGEHDRLDRRRPARRRPPRSPGGRC